MHAASNIESCAPIEIGSPYSFMHTLLLWNERLAMIIISIWKIGYNIL